MIGTDKPDGKGRRLGVLLTALASLWATGSRAQQDGCQWDVPPASPAASRPLTVTYYGVSTLVFDDGQDQLVVDGFFTRPAKILGRLRSDQALVAANLPQAARIKAVLVAHGHHDHAQDVPSLVRVAPHAVIVGTSAVAQIATAAGADKTRVCVPIAPWGRPLRYGAFRVSVFDVKHGASFFLLRWLLDRPPPRPARDGDRFWNFKDGENRSYLIEHQGIRIIVHPSAGPPPDDLVKDKADVVFLGMGRVGVGPERPTNDYFAAFLGHDPKRDPRIADVVPVHWDRFTRPLTEPLVPLSPPWDDAQEGLDRLCRFTASSQVRVWRLQAGARARILTRGLEPVSGEVVKGCQTPAGK